MLCALHTLPTPPFAPVLYRCTYPFPAPLPCEVMLELSIALAFLLLSAMPPSRLDEPAWLTETLQGWSSPDTLHSRLVTAGFDTVGKLAYSVSEGDSAAETAFIHSVLDPPGSPSPVAATLVSPSAACLRRLLHMARQSVSGAPPIPASSGAAASAAHGSKLSATELKDLKTAFTSAYPGELLTADSTPCPDFLAQLRTNLESGTSIWVPWRQRLSEAEFLSWQEHRKPRSDSQLSVPSSRMTPSRLVLPLTLTWQVPLSLRSGKRCL